MSGEVTKKETRTDIRSTILKLFEESDKRKRPFLKRWLIMTSFFNGIHAVKFDETLQQLTSLQRISPSEYAYIFNHIPIALFSSMARMLQTVYQIEGQSISQETKNTESVEIVNKLIKYIKYAVDTYDKQYTMAFYKALYGSGYEKNWINPITKKLETSIVSPLEIFPCPSATNTQDGDWIIHSYIWTEEHTKTVFQDSAEKIVGKSQQNQFSLIEKIMNLILLKDSVDTSQEKVVQIIEYWQKPSYSYPEGRYVRLFNNEIDVDEPNDFVLRQNGEVVFWNPFINKRFYVVPLSFWGVTTLTDLIGHQKWLTGFWNRISRYMEKTCDPKMLIPRGAKLVEDDDKTVIDYNPPLQPSYLIPPQSPNYIFMLLQRIYESMETVSQFTPSALYAGRRTAFEVEIREEKTIMSFSPSVNLQVADEKNSLLIKLLLIQKGFPDEVKLRIVGKNNKIEVISFNKTTIGEYELFMVGEPKIPISQAVKEQNIIQRANIGLYGDLTKAENRGKLLSSLGEIEGTDNVLSVNDLDREQAKRENHELRIDSDSFPIPDAFDSHAIHIWEHKLEMKQPEYVDLSPRIKNRLKFHLLLHEVISKNDTERLKFLIDTLEQYMTGQIPSLFDKYGLVQSVVSPIANLD